MSEDLGDVVAYFRRRLGRLEEVTFDDIREAIEGGPFRTLTAEERTKVRSILESSFNITQGRGYSIRSDYAPWLQERRSAIDFYYWNRLRDYLLGKEILPPNVLSETRLPLGGNPGLLRQSG